MIQIKSYILSIIHTALFTDYQMGNLTSIAIRKHEGLDALGPNTCGGVAVRDLSSHGPIAAVVLPTVRKCPNHKSTGYTPPKIIVPLNKSQKNLTLNNFKKRPPFMKRSKLSHFPWYCNPLLQHSCAQMLSNQSHPFHQAFNSYPNQNMQALMYNKLKNNLTSNTLDLPSPPNSLLSNPVNFSQQPNTYPSHSSFQPNFFSTPKQLNHLTTTIDHFQNTLINNQAPSEVSPFQPFQYPSNQTFSAFPQQPPINQPIYNKINNQTWDPFTTQDPKKLKLEKQPIFDAPKLDTLNEVSQIAPFEDNSGEQVDRNVLRKMIENEIDLLLVSKKPHQMGTYKKNKKIRSFWEKSAVYSDDEIDDLEDYRGESAKFRRIRDECFFAKDQWRDKKNQYRKKNTFFDENDDNDEEEDEGGKDTNCKMLEFINKFENQAHCKRMILISAMRKAISDKRKEDHEIEMAFKEMEKSRDGELFLYLKVDSMIIFFSV